MHSFPWIFLCFICCSFITLREPCNNQRPKCDFAWLHKRSFEFNCFNKHGLHRKHNWKPLEQRWFLLFLYNLAVILTLQDNTIYVHCLRIRTDKLTNGSSFSLVSKARAKKNNVCEQCIDIQGRIQGGAHPGPPP
jgi:hypothetical protein